MKSVLPALTGQGYDILEIQDGQTASREYLRVTFGKTGKAERQRVYRQLLKYCGLDTFGMLKMVEALEKTVRI